MIRNVVLVRLPDPADPTDAADATGAEADRHARAELAAGLRGIAALRLPGQLAVHVGLDAGLRAGAWTAAITSDWVDAAAYRAYDLDPEHNRHRARIVAVCADVARVQLEIEDDPGSAL